MITGDKVLGVIATYNTQEYAYGEDDLQVLSLMASQAAIALDNARLYYNLEERVKERTQQLAALQEIGVKITSQLDLREVLGSIAESANKITSADFSTLFAYDSKREKFEIGIRKGKIEVEPSMPSNTGLSARIAKTQGTIFAENAERQPGVKPTFIKNKKIKSFAGVPLIIKGRTVGILYVNFLEPHSFTKEEQETIRLLANQAAVAIENARLYQQLVHALDRIAETEAVVTRTGIAVDFVHRLNNLAGTIPIWVDHIREHFEAKAIKDETVNSYLANIESDTDGLLRAAEQLKSPPKKEDVDVESALKSLVRQVRVQMPKELQVQLDCKEKLPAVRAVASELTNALWSIMENGIDAMPGGGMLTVKAKNIVGTDDTEWVEIRISDEGTGIAKEDADRIFSPFYSTKAEHMGYGLWRAKNIVERIGGSIEFESEEELGTTFIVRLPAQGGAAKDEEKNHRPSFSS